MRLDEGQRRCVRTCCHILLIDHRQVSLVDEPIYNLSTSFAVHDKIFHSPNEEVNPMLHIAVCDDMPDELEQADNLLKKYACEHPQYEVKIYSFSAPLELLTYVERQGALTRYCWMFICREFGAQTRRGNCGIWATTVRSSF